MNSERGSIVIGTARRGDIELLARGIFLHQGRVLLVRRAGTGHSFLPGGHIEAGEPARAALRRELLEETGCRVQPGPFWGVVEHRFRQSGREVHEINLVFMVDPPPELLVPRVASREGHLEFTWVDVDLLDEANLQPAPLQAIIAGLPSPAGAPATRGYGAGWASTMEDPSRP